MLYILNERYRLRGWQKVPYAVYDAAKKTPVFLSKEKFNILARCNNLKSITFGSESVKNLFLNSPNNKSTIKAIGAETIVL